MKMVRWASVKIGASACLGALVFISCGTFNYTRSVTYAPSTVAASQFVRIVRLRQRQAFLHHGQYLTVSEVLSEALRDIDPNRYGLTVTISQTDSFKSPRLLLRGVGNLEYCIDYRGLPCSPGSEPPLYRE